MKSYDIKYDALTKPALEFKKLITSSEIMKEAILELDKFSNSNKRIGLDITVDKINEALVNNDIDRLIEYSRIYSTTSGIYMRFVRYLSGLLSYSWFIYPYLLNNKLKSNKVQDKIETIIKFFDKLNVKTVFQEITNKVLIQGCYYGYLIVSDNKKNADIFELPLKYCRSRYQINGLDAVEFNVKYFDEVFTDQEEKKLVLSTFPKDFQKGYALMKKNRIKRDKKDGGYWMLCDSNLAMKFSFKNNDIPLMVSVIPTLIELEQAKDLDLKKTMQQLLKIIVQKMPMTKDGDMLFDLDEAAAMHANATKMLGNAVNVDVLTTFADVDAIDLDNTTASTSNDPLAKVERQVFNSAGISQMLFATDGNIALEKSILNDESLMFYLLRQYEATLNNIINFLFNDKKIEFRIRMIEITIYNQEKKLKMYKEMANSGYSKMIPAIAAGYNQSEFLSLVDYENDILNLTEKLIPAQISSTQSSKNNTNNSNNSVGAPEKDDDEKSEKTIQNLESMG